MSLVESGKVAPSHEALAYFADRLGRPVAWFLTDAQDLLARIRLYLSDIQLNLRRGMHAEAAQSLREAARLAMELDDEHQLARVHEHAGHVYLAAGDTVSAVLAYREAIALHRRSSPAEELAGCTCSLANALLAEGAYDPAQAELQGARSVCASQSVRDPLVLGRISLVGGCVASAAANHVPARRMLEQALITFGGKDLAGVGETHLALGSLFAATGDWAAARLHFERALAQLDGVAAPAVLAVANRRMAETCRHLGEWERSVATVRRAGTLSAGLGDAQGTAWAAVRLAELQLEIGRRDDSRASAAEAAALLGYDTTGASPYSPQPEATWRRLYAAMLARVVATLQNQAGDHDGAGRHLTRGIEAVRGVPAGLLLQVRLLHELAAVYFARGCLAEGHSCYQHALNELSANWPGPDPATADFLDLARVPSPLWFR